MELLFTDETGTKELKEHLGFLDVDIKYKNLKGKLITATNEVIDLIGKTTYNLCVVEYKKLDTDTEKNNDFIFTVRNAIAIQGYRKYAPHNDLAHTTKGRIARLEDKEKSAFQWQIAADNEALEKSYYEALDALIKFLDAEIEEWKETEEYKTTHNLFIASAKDFDQFFPIGNSRLLFQKLAPGIRLCENNEVKARLGKTLFEAIKNDASTNDSLLYKIKEATAYYALAWAMRRLSVQLFPDGALQGYTSDRLSVKATKAPENNEAFQVAAYFEKDSKTALLEIEQMIKEINKDPNTIVEPLTFNANANDKFIST